jgi:probable F420-dependent oxidoreductase
MRGGRVKFGTTLMFTDETPSVLEVAPEVEDRDFESLWIGEHTHLPVATVFHYAQDKYRTGDTVKQGYVPDFYKRMVDPYITLTAAAAVTTTINVGTCIALPAEYNPLILAKAIATLDMISGGRFLFGVGYGWNGLEMANNGFDIKDRRAVMREKIAAMKGLWTQETAGYDGDHVSFTESWSWPKPARSPHPPVLLGAAPNPATLREVVAWADGWIPVTGFMNPDLAGDIARLHDVAREAGRDPSTIEISLVNPEGAMGGKKSKEEFLKRLPSPDLIKSYEEMGVSRCTFGVPMKDLDFIRFALDEIAGVQAKVNG